MESAVAEKPLPPIEYLPTGQPRPVKVPRRAPPEEKEELENLHAERQDAWRNLTTTEKTQRAADLQFTDGDFVFEVSIPAKNSGHPAIKIRASSPHDAVGRYRALCRIHTLIQVDIVAALLGKVGEIPAPKTADVTTVNGITETTVKVPAPDFKPKK
jgi:hypothetical protein